MTPETNRSCVLYGPGQVGFEERPMPTLDDAHDVLIKIAYVGVCGSDVHFWQHGGVLDKVQDVGPIVMGHEASGIVCAIGTGVSNLSVGDHVAIEPGVPCRRCPVCKRGRYNLCADMRFAADPPRADGTLCRVYRAPADFLYRVPPSVSLAEAVLVEPLSVAVHGARLAGLAAGQTVLVLGSGTIGLLAAAVAAASGASRVLLTDISGAKLAFAEGFVEGVATFLTGTEASPREEAQRFKEAMGVRDGVDVVLECTGVESALQMGLYAAGAGGTLVQIGMGRPEQRVPILAMATKEVVLRTAFRYGAGDYEAALGMMASGRVAVGSLVSSVTPFERAAEAWERTQRGEGIKNLIRVAD